jgi:acylpyruvate hydrolase
VLQPLESSAKIICVGLNYRDHAGESGMQVPDYPTLFARFASSLIPHGAPIIRPPESDRLDYEGELVAVIGKGGRRISKADALEHVAGYSIFNDGSIRDFQLRTPQWTMGKNFDSTGAFGPVFVTADALPPGARGLKIETRLNGKVMQSASTDDLIFDVATLVSLISVGITLEPGDIIVTGTPSGVGAARKPPVFMKSGDVCEIEIEQIGVLSNRIVDEDSTRANAA